MPEGKTIVKSTMALMLITLLVKLLGYLEKVILAYYFGTNIEVDVFLVVMSIIISVFILFRELIEPGFLIVFLRIPPEKNEEAWAFFNAIGKYLFYIVLVVFITGICFSKELIDFFAPGFNNEKKSLALDLLQISLPSIIFLCMSNLTYITLNSQKVFILPALGDIVFKFSIIVMLVLLYPKYGIMGAGWGIIIGAVGKLAMHLVGLRKRILLKKQKVNSVHFKNMWILTWPLLLGVLFSQSSSLIDNIYASYFKDGSIAALGYSKKIIEMPILIFPYVLGIIVFPYFSRLSIEKNLEKLTILFYSSLGWIIFIFLPLSVFFYIFASPIVKVLLQRGAFNEASTLLTSQPMMIYSIGMTIFAIETVTVLLFFSLSDTKTPILVGIICAIINIIATISLIPFIGYLAIALSLVISKSLKMIMLFYMLKRKKIQMCVRLFLLKILSATFMLYIYIILAQYIATKYLLQDKMVDSKSLLFYFISGFAFYIIFCYALNMKQYVKKGLGF